MSAENILTKILLEIGLDIKMPQLTSEEYEIMQIRNVINQAGDDIARRAEWSKLHKEWNIGAYISEIALPADFLKIAQKGAVKENKSGYAPRRLITVPQEWQLVKRRPSRQGFYHLSDGKILFAPYLPREGASVLYVSKNWVVGKSEITQNGDEILIPERLIVKGAVWRWKRQKGMPFEDIVEELEADMIVEINADRGYSR